VMYNYGKCFLATRLGFEPPTSLVNGCSRFFSTLDEFRDGGKFSGGEVRGGSYLTSFLSLLSPSAIA
jgi:hypothetical protein